MNRPVIVSMILAGTLAGSAHATDGQNSIGVTGEADEKVKPDVAYVAVYALAEGILMKDAVKKAVPTAESSSCDVTCDSQELVPGLDPHSDALNVLYGLTIRPAPARHSASKSQGARHTSLGRPIPWLIFGALDVPMYRMILETSRDLDATYDLIVNLPDSLNARRDSLVEQAIEHALGLSIGWETREVDAYQLMTVPGAATPTQPRNRPPLKIVAGTGSLDFRGSQMSKVASYIEDVIQMPVTDDTGLEGLYNIRLDFEIGSMDSLNAALKEHGLFLQKSRQSIDVFVVRDAVESE